jgi:hypothetical protein
MADILYLQREEASSGLWEAFCHVWGAPRLAARALRGSLTASLSTQSSFARLRLLVRTSGAVVATGLTVTRTLTATTTLLLVAVVTSWAIALGAFAALAVARTRRSAGVGPAESREGRAGLGSFPEAELMFYVRYACNGRPLPEGVDPSVVPKIEALLLLASGISVEELAAWLLDPKASWEAELM